MTYREQIESLTKLKFPGLTSQTVPWYSHARVCNLQSWTILPSSKPSVSIEEQTQPPQQIESVTEEQTSKPEIREDGELPSLNPLTITNEISQITVTPLKGSGIEHSKRLSFITKSMASPMSKGKSPSFRKIEEDLDLMVSDSENDDLAQTEPDTDEGINVINNMWVACGTREYRLVLTRKANNGDGYMKLDAKVLTWSEGIKVIF